jgi:methylated-DNA-[protein]-cysteine S-methyltransferase
MFVGGRLVRLGFGRCQALPRAERRLVNRLAGDLASYFAGKPRRWETSLDLSGGTAFQRRVWRELAKVPFGATVSYGELARRVGRPGAARAVGQAVGANPIPILIPCHRVICSDGGLGGFSAGLEIKRWLLAHEGCL